MPFGCQSNVAQIEQFRHAYTSLFKGQVDEVGGGEQRGREWNVHHQRFDPHNIEVRLKQGNRLLTKELKPGLFWKGGYSLPSHGRQEPCQGGQELDSKSH